MSPLLIAVLAGLLAMLIWVGLFALGRHRFFRGCGVPFTRKYLRSPGESVRRRLDALVDRFDGEILLVPAACFLLGLGVFAFVSGEKPVGRLFGLLGLGALALLLVRFNRFSEQIANHRLGFLGERAVGEELNRLLAEGWCVFHDVPLEFHSGAEPFNLDHVVVGPGGVCAVETTTRRKRRAKDGHEVLFDGRFLHFPWGREFLGPDNTRFRAKALAAWLSNSLQREIPVVPVLVLLGWFVRREGNSDLRVVSDGELLSLFRGLDEQRHLGPAAVQDIRDLLEGRCRDVTLD